MKWRLYKEKLLWLRLNKGWSQEEAAFECDASDKKQYHLWETGKTTRPRKGTLEKIAKAFELDSVDDIILQPSAQVSPELNIFYNAHFHHKLGDEFHGGRGGDTGPFKLVCFSLGATLTPDVRLVWNEIWERLGDEENTRKQGLRMFHQKKLSYEELCVWACELLRKKGLTKKFIEDFAAETSLAPNLVAGLEQLKREGYILAVISGGPSTFFEALLPDYNKYFDYVFLNKLSFDQSGLLKSIVPTPFDYATKPDGIRYVCAMENLQTKNAVFVGANYWDQYAYEDVGLSLGYYDPFPGIRDLFDESINDKDFMSVVDKVRSVTQEPVEA